MAYITSIESIDIRFPTSEQLDGSDAMNPDPDYSAAYCVLHTSEGPEGHGMTFTIGRGNDLCVAAISQLGQQLIGLELTDLRSQMGPLWKKITGDSQFRWLGPEKGVVHLAAAALMNALWDLLAKQEELPLWRLLSTMSGEELYNLVDWNYLSDVVSKEEIITHLNATARTADTRITVLEKSGYPAYTTSAGWLGYSDEKMRELLQEAVDAGWTTFKMKVGSDLDDDKRRARLIREFIGQDGQLMMDANQVWGVNEAIRWMRELSEFSPGWIEEPTSPDDILGHAKIARALAPIPVATGEHCHNAVMFKQFMEAGGLSICQLDSCRLASINEIIGVLILAWKFEIPVCPHAGGVGLCEYVQHISMFDYTRVSCSTDGRVIEYVDHLHDHFKDPVRLVNGRYAAPEVPGYSIEMHPQTLSQYVYPDGPVWSSRLR
ncbi:fuconate dehydratase [Litoricolaceae bacterium]|nr:fuconate dehydratase [Litorivicinaceae bacterium]